MSFWGKLFGKKDEKPTSTAQNSASVDKEVNIKCNFTVEQQKEWLEKINRIIPTIMIGGNPLCVDHHLHPRMLEEAGNMLNTVGRIALAISQTLEITNMEKAVQKTTIQEMTEVYHILNEYASMLKEPYCDAIKKKNSILYNIISSCN